MNDKNIKNIDINRDGKGIFSRRQRYERAKRNEERGSE
jgi:hypothetical protein